MKRNRNVLFLLMVLISLMVLPMATLAEDETPAPTDEPAATAEADQTIQVTVTAGEPTANEGSTVILSALQVVIGLISAFGIGGLVGVAAIGTLAGRLRNDAATVAALELLAKQVPPETAQQIMDFATGLNTSVAELTLLAKEVLDGIPAASKPPAQPPV